LQHQHLNKPDGCPRTIAGQNGLPRRSARGGNNAYRPSISVIEYAPTFGSNHHTSTFIALTQISTTGVLSGPDNVFATPLVKVHHTINRSST
jgi:hypothetical protein